MFLNRIQQPAASERLFYRHNKVREYIVMSTTKCSSCNKDVSKTAELCPHCGQKNPGITFKEGAMAFLVMIFLGFILVSCISSDDEPEEPEKIQISGIDYFDMKEEVICGSKYSEQKVEHLFKEHYKNKYVQWTGIISSIDDDELKIKMDPSTFTYDVSIDMKSKDKLFDLEVDQYVTVQFKIIRKGGCFLPVSGKYGVLI